MLRTLPGSGEYTLHSQRSSVATVPIPGRCPEPANQPDTDSAALSGATLGVEMPVAWSLSASPMSGTLELLSRDKTNSGATVRTALSEIRPERHCMCNDQRGLQRVPARSCLQAPAG